MTENAEESAIGTFQAMSQEHATHFHRSHHHGVTERGRVTAKKFLSAAWKRLLNKMVMRVPHRGDAVGKIRGRVSPYFGPEESAIVLRLAQVPL